MDHCTYHANHHGHTTGDDVIINAYTNHTNPEIQCDGVGDYHEFKPFRFVEKGRQATRVGDDFLFFGQGQHACP